MFLFIFIYLINSDLIYNNFDLINFTDFMGVLSRFFTTPTYNIYIYIFIFLYFFQIKFAFPLFLFLTVHFLIKPISLVAEGLNPLLINSLNLIHPFLVNFFLIFNLINLIIIILNSSGFIFFYEKLLNATRCILIPSFFFLISLFLGGFWALQIGTWGGWWVWDLSETLLIFFYQPLLFSTHLVNLNLEFSKLFLFLFLFFIFYFFIDNLVFNSLNLSLHTFLLNPLNLINLLFLKFFLILILGIFNWKRLRTLSFNFFKFKYSYLTVHFLVIPIIFVFLLLMPISYNFLFSTLLPLYLITQPPLKFFWRLIAPLHLFLFLLLFYYLICGVCNLNFFEVINPFTLPYTAGDAILLDSSSFIFIFKENFLEKNLKLFIPELVNNYIFSINSVMQTPSNLNFYQKTTYLFFENLL